MRGRPAAVLAVVWALVVAAPAGAEAPAAPVWAGGPAVPAPAGEPSAAARADDPTIARGTTFTVVAGCTDVLVALTAHVDPAARPPANGSHLGWDVTATADGRVLRLPGTFLQGPTWEGQGLRPGTRVHVAFTPRLGYGGLPHRLAVTTATGCPPAPAVALVAATRTTVTLEVTPPRGATRVLVSRRGAAGAALPSPMLVAAQPVGPAAGPTRVTVRSAPYAVHELGVAVSNAAGTSAAVPVRTPLLPDTRTVERLAGRDRFATAARLAVAALRDGAGATDGGARLVVASGLDFPDALAAANLGWPVVLTERDTLPDATRAVLADGGLREVVVAGGSAAVSPGVVDAVTEAVGADVTVRRVAGATRFATAAALAAAGLADRGVEGRVPAVVLASGEGFADALAAGALTGAGGIPLVLTGRDVLPAEAAALLARLEPDVVLVAGGPAAVAAGTAAAAGVAAGAAVERLAGRDRTGTAAAIARHGIAADVLTGVDAVLARGDAFPDALAASALAAARRGPILLTPSPTLLGPGATGLLEEAGCTVERVVVAGGSLAVAASVAEAVAGPCDAGAIDRRSLVLLADLVREVSDLLARTDGRGRPAGSLAYLVGPSADLTRPIHVATTVGHDASAARYLPVPVTLRAAPVAVDGVVPPDAPMHLWVDRDGDGTCGPGEDAVTFTLAGETTPGIC